MWRDCAIRAAQLARHRLDRANSRRHGTANTRRRLRIAAVAAETERRRACKAVSRAEQRARHPPPAQATGSHPDDDGSVVFTGERSAAQRNAEGFANAIVISDDDEPDDPVSAAAAAAITVDIIARVVADEAAAATAATSSPTDPPSPAIPTPSSPASSSVATQPTAPAQPGAAAAATGYHPHLLTRPATNRHLARLLRDLVAGGAVCSDAEETILWTIAEAAPTGAAPLWALRYLERRLRDLAATGLMTDAAVIAILRGSAFEAELALNHRIEELHREISRRERRANNKKGEPPRPRARHV